MGELDIFQPAEERTATFSSQLLEQYKLYVELTDRVSQRRLTINTLFLSVKTLIVGFIGLMYPKNPLDIFGAVILLLIGTSLCLLWRLMIGSYSQLNKLRFSIIAEMEKLLPARPFSGEWDLLKNQPSVYKYTRSSKLEKTVPLMLIGLYLIIFLLYVLKQTHSI
jgi:hypothetical protein